jgi:hypothetical protein
MKVGFSATVALMLLLLQTACGGALRSTDSERATAITRSGNAIVIPASQFGVRNGSLLEALVSRLASMRVERSAGRCPVVSLRGRKTIIGSPNPGIYVDGAHAVDTCILHHIRVADVDRVEVYPGGHSNSPEYTPNPNGLILVFLTGPQRR